MREIKLLDCTLRDGGSVNNWQFGEKNILKILQTLNDANIDIVETGFIDNNVIENKNSSINPSNKVFDDFCKKITNKKCRFYAMIDFSKYNQADFNLTKSKEINGIRIMFKKEQLLNVIEFCKKLNELNYEICLNPVSVTSYTKEELINLINVANLINPKVLYIVDTYGLLSTKETIEYFELFDKNLNQNIEIGYHVHNNLQLALKNSIEVINYKTKRNIIIDASLYGMGKRAGNTEMETLSLYLNENFDFQYDTNKLIKIIEEIIIPIKKDYQWGYSLIHYIAAINKCHSDYVTYLCEEKKLPVDEICEIVQKIPCEKKLTFDKDYILKYTNN